MTNDTARKAQRLDENNPLASFAKQFRFSIAHDKASRYRAYALRHKVFRQELNYDLGENTDIPFENDAHDKHAILCLLNHIPSGIDTGCLRVVLIPGNATQPLNTLPLEQSCGHSLDHPKLHPSLFHRSTICEVSRLAVHSAFRRSRDCVIGLNEHDIRQLSGHDVKPFSPLLGLSLFLAATAIVGLSGRRHVFAMMEPRFSRLLKMSGLAFHKVGRVIDYCGPRAAYYIDQHQAERDMHDTLRPLYRHIVAELSPQLTESSAQRLIGFSSRPLDHSPITDNSDPG
ncbi:PEP-CTERM/exosortase system-associated acyltransferase [Halomonas sp. DQ26W]|uniref:PEP-CTERM/exosortase system-associated acyltransferase n=1 Tax=Halomonas sp. DQ26W TaxID=2282311 RepID=UPI000DF74CA4|nr:PEP-CTERM/exosortase system-associated acyltransferase [Halomonas sp. DQ26W]RDB43600.1 PEP-CTERM/exosortase system-associated acyltransferase [Halomonas sp. DQ26W]